MARISLSQIFNQGLRGILNVQAQSAKTQNQIATGKRVLTPSDDPVAAARILQVEQQQNASIQYRKNIDGVESSLMMEETQLDAVTNLLVRVRELTVQAGNGALTYAERQSIGAELGTRLDELQSLANSRNPSGEYIFGGFQGEQAPFVSNGDGTFGYRGDDGQRLVQISDSTRVASGDNGLRIFHAVPMDVVPAQVGSLVPRLTADPANAGSLSALTIDDGTQFAASFPPGTAYSVVVTAEPVAPATDFDYEIRRADGSVAQSGQFADGDTLTFGGLTFDLSTPALNDSYTLAAPPPVTISSGNIVDRVALAASFPSAASSYSLTITSVPVAPATDYGYSVSDANGLVSSGTFERGEALEFGGAEFRIVGDVAAGDAFTLSAPQTQSTLDTVGKLVQGLSSLGDSAEDKLRLKDLLAETLSNLEKSEDQVGVVRSQVGARLNTLDSTRDLHEGTELVNSKILSEIRDLDYAEAITRLTQENFVLQAAQQSFAQVSKLSLFNFLR